MWTFTNKFIFVLFAVLVFQNYVLCTEENNATNALHKLSVEVFYEALCIDSMRFIRHQLFPFFMQHDNLQHADLKFIPYGKANLWTNPDTNVTQLFCQHGPRECELNALHACIVQHNNQVEQLKMINCLLKGFSTNANKCAKNLGIDISAAIDCQMTNSVLDILSKYDKETNSLKLSFVPAIVFNNVFKRNEQESIFYNFQHGFCKSYQQAYNSTPKGCDT